MGLSPTTRMFASWAGHFSPSQLNPGKLRVFRENELTVEMLLASACLPKFHHPVEIDGQPYWDGGTAPTRRCSRCFMSVCRAMSCWCY